jgi:small ligand-binding sensory domain FIST
MRFASAVSRAEAAADVTAELRGGVAEAAGDGLDLAVFFFTSHLAEAARAIARELRSALQPRVVAGVSSESIIGGDLEVEGQPGASLLVGRLPDVTLRPFRIGCDDWHALLSDDERLHQRVRAGETHVGQLVLADPFTTPIDPVLSRFDEVLQASTFGGMASGGTQPGSNVLILNDEAFTDGLVGVGLGGRVRIDTVVSQGCRPVGQPAVITRAEGNRVVELGRRPALEVAREVLAGFSEEENRLVRQGRLFLGVAINEYQKEFRRGDFLIRGVMGVDPASGSLAIGDHIRPGQTVQFHVRDAATAHEDLVELLEPQSWQGRPAGGLVFSCNGRGLRMFEEPGHDVRTTLSVLPGVPLAGFFAMGELGPVGGKSFIHGHTASLALFRPE